MTRLTACTMDCGDCCSLVADPEKKTIRGNPDHPFTKGFCCSKGSRFFDRINADDRITTPLIKKNGSFCEASWEEALSLVAEKIDALRATPEKILHVRGFGYRGILAKASQLFFKKMGSSTIYGAVCDGTGIEACLRDFGALAHNDPEDILNADRVVNWGRDMTRCSVHQLQLIRKARKNGTKVLTISPGGDGTPDFSDLNITIRPGTDRFLAAAVLKLYLEAGNLNPKVLDRCANWPALRDIIDEYELSALASVCEVSTTDVETLYDWYADTGTVATIVSWGLQRYTYGGENVRFINALAMVSGNIGRSGGGAYYNISSGRNLGSWEHLILEESPDRRQFLVQDLGAELRRADPEIEFVWVDGHNVVNQVPDCLAVAEGFRKPFVVCVDGFMHDTAMPADVILPPAFMMEHEDVLGSMLHNYVQYSGKVMEPRGQCRTDFDILTDLGSRLADPIILPDTEACLLEGLKKGGFSLEELRTNGFIKAKHPRIAFENMRFGHPDGLHRFPETLTPEPPRDPDYPLQLLTLLRRKTLHSQIPEKDQCGVPRIWVSKKNPAWAPLNPAQDVYLVTPQGAMQVQLEVDDSLHPRAVVMRRGGWMKRGHNANVIIKPMLTDMGDGTAYYSQCCRLENR